MITATTLTGITDALVSAYRKELQEALTEELRVFLDKWNREKLPAFVAQASRVVEIQMYQRADRPSLQVEFVITDLSELKL